jgi:hypothetical protein
MEFYDRAAFAAKYSALLMGGDWQYFGNIQCFMAAFIAKIWPIMHKQ